VLQAGKEKACADGMGMIGEMEMTIPPFVKVEHDEASRKAYVSVEDKEVKKQREMWGAFSFHNILPYDH